MKITFTGSHSTGKTTLLKELQATELSDRYTFVDEITRQLPKETINKNGNEDTQKYVIAAHKENILLENCILDRGIFDGLAYTEYMYKLGRVSEDIVIQAFQAFIEIAPQYDIVFFLPIEFDLVKDGVRDEDDDFRNWINNRIRILTQTYSEHYNLVTVTGTVEERVKQCMEHIRKGEQNYG